MSVNRMRRASFSVMLTFALLGLVPSVPLAAEKNAPAAVEETAPSSETAQDARVAPPENAAAALVRAKAAYEYGDMNQVVEAARPVAEGLLPASSYDQAQAFRLLGIGLYLTDRRAGAETAFGELLRLDPRARLNPTTTRPEVVAFFENLRRQQLPSQRRVIWNFIPPAGQFQNQDNIKGWIVLSVGVASLVGFVTSDLLLRSWQKEGHTFPDYDTATGMRAANWVSAGVLAATYIYGVFDGLVGYSRPIEESGSSVSLRVSPGGLGFAF
jgi:hypothetical protein